MNDNMKIECIMGYKSIALDEISMMRSCIILENGINNIENTTFYSSGLIESA